MSIYAIDDGTIRFALQRYGLTDWKVVAVEPARMILERLAAENRE